MEIKGKIVEKPIGFSQYVTDLQLLNMKVAQAYKAYCMADNAVLDISEKKEQKVAVSTRKKELIDNLQFLEKSLKERMTEIATGARLVLKRSGAKGLLDVIGTHAEAVFTNPTSVEAIKGRIAELEKRDATYGTLEEIERDRENASILRDETLDIWWGLNNHRENLLREYPEYVSLVPDGIASKEPDYDNTPTDISQVHFLGDGPKTMSKSLATRIKAGFQPRDAAGHFVKSN